ncbi:hypothetical protein IC607_08565 [Cellulomonas sp. JH27-2]|uniref:hypothetical protein n=1 Tax=Cellulomonas sp. JH27-2 TaxID=2774139 RepID=UPI00177B6EFB|nr:hypothetical protein [Cellulomonas sp. JH27-2]MBD8059019.1 hypothetical protein [Cellulomonas sp. JH27-2]
MNDILEMAASTAETRTLDGGQISRVVDRPARPGRLWADQHGAWWCTTASEPVAVGGVRFGYRVTSRLATADEIRRHHAGTARLLAVLHGEVHGDV